MKNKIVVILLQRYIMNILVAIDRLGNTVLLGNNNETISSRAGRWMHTSPVALWVCKLLHRFDKNHCQNNVEKYHNDTAVWDKPIGGLVVLTIIGGVVFWLHH